MTARLRDLRLAQGLTTVVVGERLEVPAQNIRRIEAGQNLTLKTLARTAAALGYEVAVTFVQRSD